jgi:hypothetical protein
MLLAALGCAVAGCAARHDTLLLGVTPPSAPAAASTWRADVWRRGLADRPPSSGAALAVGASDEEIIGARLDVAQRDARQWRLEIEVASGPVLTRDAVLLGSGTRLVALSPETGQPRWERPAPGDVLAASRGSRSLALLFDDRRRRRWIGVYDDAGREQLRVGATPELGATAPLGAPTLLGGTLLVPFGAGALVAIDVASQRMLGRVELGQTLLQPLWSSGTLFFGGPPWTALAPGLPVYDLPRRPLPGESSTPAAASEPARLYVHPERASEPAETDVYMVTYGRLSIGLTRERGSLAWVSAAAGRVLAAASVDGGFLVCDESGGVRWLSERSGHVAQKWQLTRRRRVTLGEPALRACALSVGRVLAPEPSASKQDARDEPLLEQIASVLGISDPRMTEAQRFLSRELAARPEPEATRVLIELVMRHSLDRALQAEAEDLLATRRNGVEYMLAALARTDDTSALPPIAPLAEALAALGERAAAPLLARQLNRPAHGAAALARTAAALETLASEAEYAELSVFFSLHRTTADEPDWTLALISTARTLLAVGGDRARTLIRFAARDPLTVPEVRSVLEALLANAQSPRAQ